MKKLTKFEIATKIEKLPGNKPWSSWSLATIWYNSFTRKELVDIYNRELYRRGLFDHEEIS